MRGSISTTVTFFAFSRMRTVRLPVPGPTSSTVSVGLRAALSTMPWATSGFLRICWPNFSVLKMGFFVVALVFCCECAARGAAFAACVCAEVTLLETARGMEGSKKKMVEALHVKRGAALGIEPRTSRIFEFRDSPKARIILLDHTAGKAKKTAGCASLNTCIIPVRKRAATRSVALVRRLTRHEPAWVFWSAAQRYVAELTIGETFELRADRTCDTLTQ